MQDNTSGNLDDGFDSNKEFIPGDGLDEILFSDSHIKHSDDDIAGSKYAGVDMPVYAEVFIVKLHQVHIDNRRHYFEMLPPEDMVFLPDSVLEPYRVLYSDWKDNTGIFDEALPSFNNQQNMFSNQSIEIARGKYASLFSQGKISQIPDNIFRHFEHKIPFKLKEFACVLQGYALYERKNRLLADFIEANFNHDPHAVEEVFTELKSLPADDYES
jgi:hypothetical protein